MQPSYRAIFAEVLLVHSAAIEAFANAAARCAVLAGQQYQETIVAMADKIAPNDGNDDRVRSGGHTSFPGTCSAGLLGLSRAFAGLPRISTMVFLSRYDDLRERRGVVRERPRQE
jgi:hypothetical protein